MSVTVACHALNHTAVVTQHAGAHGGFSSVTVTGPIATTTADLMLVYAALANVNYPASPSKPTPQAKTNTRKARKGADAAVSAAAAVAAPPLQPLELPKQLLPDLESGNDVTAQLMQSASWKPLTGMSFGVCREWYTMCEPGVLAAVDRAAEVLFKFGATLVDVHIAELDLLQVGAWVFFAQPELCGVLCAGICCALCYGHQLARLLSTIRLEALSSS